METRELRYFVAVAQELHFGRAAQRLGIAQPPLSRAVAQLERRLGTALLTRSSRSVALTPAGEVLLAEARAALAAVEAAERRTRRAGSTDRPGLVLAVKAGASAELLAKLLDAHAAEPDAVPVDVLLVGIGEQGQVLRDGRADVALLHRPFDDLAGLDVEELGTEGQIAVLPAGHELGTRPELVLADLDGVPGLPAPRWPGPSGVTSGPGPQVRDHAQLLQLIGLGRTFAVLPDSVRGQLPEGLRAVPVADAPAVTTVIAWPPHSRSLAVAGLVRTALRL
ncbi:DNA-binding transcriptional regulator, LysR family [Klenkia marina]|uniref:DNA-binding transcriptional regulator, LysR family n=1 Tax=Klenkia marina TaxID=1960309 RepID=A0A1G4Z2Y8_9ACTN|nr:LysR family transcriptional regulator [Klenkia marina]SCX59588.1 DNA-binding transcriptional regulator, LysR family [Klenkia marina]